MRRREAQLSKDIARGKYLARRWDPEARWSAFNEKDGTILWRYWKGLLQEELRQLQAQPRDKGPQRLEPFRVT